MAANFCASYPIWGPFGTYCRSIWAGRPLMLAALLFWAVLGDILSSPLPAIRDAVSNRFGAGRWSGSRSDIFARRSALPDQLADGGCRQGIVFEAVTGADAA